MATNEALVKTLRPTSILSIEDRHKARVRAVQHTQNVRESKRTFNISRNSNWSDTEVRILGAKGFTIFVGDKFLARCKYVAALRCPNNGLASVSENGRWTDQIQYNGDIPDSVINKIETIDRLVVHDHKEIYPNHERTVQLFDDLQYLVVSTCPLPVVRWRKADPFLLAFKWDNTTGPLIAVSARGRIKRIRETLGEYSFLLVGMWNMNEEVFA